jgi:predicted transcriptional regulator
MTTVTVLDSTAKRWQSLAYRRGVSPEELLISFLDEWEEIENAPLSPEDLASIGKGLAQFEAGEGIDGDTVFEELTARLKARSTS